MEQSPQVISQTPASSPQQLANSNKNLPLIIGGLVILILVGVSSYVLGSRFQQNRMQRVLQTPTHATDPTGIPTNAQNKTKTSNVNLMTGFSFSLPLDWTAKISNQSKDYFYGKFYLPSTNKETTFVEIESINSNKVSKNPMFKFDSNNTSTINGLNATISEGKEEFKNSNRVVKQVTFNNSNYSLVVTLLRNPKDMAINQFDAFIQSVQTNNQKQSKQLIKEVFADESISGISLDKFVKIEVMGDPLPERITKNDLPYKNGYAKFYYFEAFKGQRLTTVAYEDQTNYSHSFIRSELYSEEGKLISSKDTRIEFDTPYTGKYYYIVSTFNSQEGPYLLKVFDRNQIENLMYVKYDDGSEKLVDPNVSPPLYEKKPIAIIIQFVNPIELINNQVRYFAKSHEFEPGLGLITRTLKVYVKQETYEDWSKLSSAEEEYLGNNDKYLVNSKFTKLSQSKIIVEPTDGTLFSAERHIIVNDDIAGGRIFTY